MKTNAVFEADVATLIAKISASSLNRALDVKEPFDAPDDMVPVAYAMFEVLCKACAGSGRDDDWYDFLSAALKETIARVENLSTRYT